MHHGLRMLLALLLLFSLLASLSAVPAAAQPSPPAPVRPTGTPGFWYSGAIPPNFDPAKPVLVFVHGKGGSAANWWGSTAYHGTNDMYTYAYNSGFRTAFVDLEPEADMWANGQLLNQQLSQITNHFNVDQVVIISHSKGGVDANAAAAFFGAGPKIQKVITLAAPHWGTPVADLAYSTWAWWITALLGQNTDASYVMQTGYMAWFRSVADASTDEVDYYTVSGRKCGPFLTALWWGCVYLSGYDDGIVPVGHSHKPGAGILSDGWWDHDEIRMGSRTWSTLAPLLEPDQAMNVGPLGLAGSVEPTGQTSILARGGEVEGKAAGEPFPIESGVRGVSLTFYASSPDFVAAIKGPDGAVHTVKMDAKVPAGEIFAGAHLGTVAVAKPAAGVWRLETAAPQKAGYLMVASFDSDFAARLTLDRLLSAPGETLHPAVTFSREPASLRVSVNGTALTAPQTTITLPQQEGIQNLTVTVTGTLPDGTAFERTLVGSVAVVPAGAKASWTGK